jgi:hypothetical protein
VNQESWGSGTQASLTLTPGNVFLSLRHEDMGLFGYEHGCVYGAAPGVLIR